MIDPKRLRETAQNARNIASRGPKSSTYLMGLADQLDAEAARLEAHHAGSKPLPALIDPGALIGVPHK